MISVTLSQTAEYALRAMVHLALLSREGPARARELAAATGVPLPYLLKIMRRLAEAGLVLSAKGHGGGFRLARPAGRISYLEVLQAAGYGAEPNACVFGWGKCREDRPCPMHNSWSALNSAFLAWAGTNTLAAVRPEPAPKRRRSAATARNRRAKPR